MAIDAFISLTKTRKSADEKYQFHIFKVIFRGKKYAEFVHFFSLSYLGDQFFINEMNFLKLLKNTLFSKKHVHFLSADFRVLVRDMKAIEGVFFIDGQS